MDPPVDVSLLPPAAQRILDPASPAPLRNMAARGIVPGLKPHEALTVLALLAEANDATAKVADTTIRDLPPPFLAGALTAELHPGVLTLMAPYYAKNAAVMERFLMLPQLPGAAVIVIAQLGSEAVTEIVATNEERLLREPAIIEKLYMNAATRMSTANRVLELAVRNKIHLKGIGAFEEAAEAIAHELIPEPSPEPTYSDILNIETDALARSIEAEVGEVKDTFVQDETTGEEKIEKKFVPLYVRLDEMSMSEKVRRAVVGTASERLILVRDKNKTVSNAVVKSPAIQEGEVARISMMRNVGDDVLSHIARSPKWSRSYQIKLNLVQNPRTPFLHASKIIGHLYEHDLKALMKSKNVTGAIQTAARQQLQRKGKL